MEKERNMMIDIQKEEIRKFRDLPRWRTAVVPIEKVDREVHWLRSVGVRVKRGKIIREKGVEVAQQLLILE